MSENPKIVYVPWYIADWLSDALSLDPHEYYLYHRILMEQYKDGAPVKRSMCERIANALRTLCGVEATTAQEKLAFVLERFFVETEDGFSNKRAESEIAKYVSKSEKARESAKCKGKKVANAERTLTERNANAERTPSDRSANQNQNQNQNIDIRSASAPAPSLVADADLVADAPDTQSDEVSTVDISTSDRSKGLGGSSKTMLLSEAVQTLPEDWRGYAQKVRPDLDPEITFTNFVYYWSSGKGAGKRRSVRGWASSWQTWVRNEKSIQSAPSQSSNGYSKIRRTPEEEAKAIAGAKAYWEWREAEAQRQASSDPFDRAMKKDSEKEAEKQIEDALGGFGMIHNVRGRR
jgi:uncharacterized protein YdaU (DUF1376 family)